ncbi:coxsackievirus and adenovirus receptor homolog [Anabas testudineus]|uniref:coxsackievirus and adenovirus receptor homolog n=1 Tax=Anabas testudineus TaxID=64144 RepID=UPI000E4540E1|nr:coxsackievirus and adenovirus receptor homolog [Anabas testudineus]
MSTSRFTCVVCFLTCFLNCSTSTEVTAEYGEDVILHCHSPRDADIEMLEWIKPDLNSDDYVFFFRENHRYDDYQHPSFHGRVTLRDPTMKDGDASVILKNVTMKDAGTYQCYVGKRSSQHSKRSVPELMNTITLKVEEPKPGESKECVVFNELLLIYVEHKVVKVKSGDTVTLPCRGFSNTPVKSVKWIRSDLEHGGCVYMLQDGRYVPDNQHPNYKNLVELKDTEMKDGDVSLILKNAMPVDSGTYECYVSQGGTNRKKRDTDRPITIIHLRVEPGTNKDGGDKDGGDRIRHLGLSVALFAVVAVVF